MRGSGSHRPIVLRHKRSFSMRPILITGGAGFIGSCLVRQLVGREHRPVVNLDKLTYAGNLDSLEPIADDPNHVFVEGDIGDRALVARCWPSIARRPSSTWRPSRTSIARSTRPATFVETNVAGHVSNCSKPCGHYWSGLAEPERGAFRFLHVSTDEVYRFAGADGPLHRDDALRAQLALLGVQGRGRSFCPAPITTPTACPRSRPTARTTTARTSFPKS